MELIQSKTLLAKLMATENLIIEQRNVQTASFDVKNRVLTVPVLDKNISGHLYDLFMGHEVGHALYTPLSGMVRAHEEKIPMSIMNVLEDVRIERKIKNKYPGIRISFVRAYRELIDKDFFGTNDTDLNDLNFIDRVNMYTKGGAAQGIKFTPYEQTLVSKIEGTETYDDVMVVARLVCDYLKEEAEEHKKNHPEEFEEDEDGDYEGFDSEGYDDSDDWDEDTENRKGDDDSDSGEEETDEELDSEKTFNSGGSKPNEIESQTKSYTDESYRKNESKLFAQDNSTHYYGNIPDVDLSKAIVNHKSLWKRYRNSATDALRYRADDFTGTDIKKFMKLRNDSKKVVGYLAKEFELRKNADQLKRASIAKTGDLNMNKIYSYQLTDDIFKKMTVVPGAKSHGLVMFLDWSGSMSDHMENTIKQLINLVMFCKKVNIPYDVYAFSQEYDEPYRQEFKEGDIELHNFKLLNLLSSKMTAAEFTYAGSALVQMSTYRYGWKPNWFQKGGTPLNEAVISAMKIVPEFQKQYKLQIVNTVFLTDGEGHSNREVFYTNNSGHKTSGTTNKEIEYNSNDWKTQRQLVLRDPINKNQEIVSRAQGRDLTAAYIKLLKQRTQCNIVGFYVLSGRELGRELYHFYPNAGIQVQDKIKYEFRKNKSLTVTNAGFDEYYLLRSEGLDTDEDVSFEVKQNATTRGLVSAFSKFAGNRLNNRVVLNRFIGLIS
jgi:hypothetical protein